MNHTKSFSTSMKGGVVEWGTTVKGYFDPVHHDCWLPMPKFPDSVKNRYRVEVENGKT